MLNISRNQSKTSGIYKITVRAVGATRDDTSPLIVNKTQGVADSIYDHPFHQVLPTSLERLIDLDGPMSETRLAGFLTVRNCWST